MPGPKITASPYVRPSKQGFRLAVVIFQDGKIVSTRYGNLFPTCEAALAAAQRVIKKAQKPSLFTKILSFFQRKETK